MEQRRLAIGATAGVAEPADAGTGGGGEFGGDPGVRGTALCNSPARLLGVVVSDRFPRSTVVRPIPPVAGSIEMSPNAAHPTEAWVMLNPVERGLS